MADPTPPSEGGQSPAGEGEQTRRGGLIHSTGGRRKRSGRRHRGLRIAVLATAGAVLLGTVAATALYLRFEGNISDVDIEAALGTDRPQDVPDGSLDLLVLGSDARTGDGGGDSDEGDEGDDGARADTAMIVHVNEGYESASIVSVPRDTLVPRPECRREDGSIAPAEDEAMFNEAYAVGGPACAVATVEKMTGIRMDHYVEIDFQGFEKIVDTLGGVDITLTRDIQDEDSHLDLEAGTQTLDGEAALALVRTRKNVGDGSDLGRIQLQHAFIRAFAEKAASVGVADSPRKLYDLADTATAAVTTDTALASVPRLASLAGLLRGIDADDLQLVTLPVEYDERDRNRVVPLEPQTGMVWAALRRDEPVPPEATRGSVAEDTEAEDLVEEDGTQGPVEESVPPAAR
ncbi:LCP family protein [Streptomyces sp. ACA25]|uniref:LCP family protein n=1 Tax=Streptomyces sp. ACA25 TaxID=3022596 RepID=UPI00230811C8|nr:LCP family protein [Streptomyces sp. ACA25]MDB1087618.1 LCP family protein [Streptomyces sp. ACA25]